MTPTPVPTPADQLGDPLPRPIRQRCQVALTSIASGFDAPVAASGAPGIDPRYLYVADQSGIWWRVDVTDGSKVGFPRRHAPVSCPSASSAPARTTSAASSAPRSTRAYATNGLVYTYTSEPATPAPGFLDDAADDAPGSSERHHGMARHQPGNAASVVDPLSARELLRFDKPQFNHNGGALQFSPADGKLYVSIGDGGGADDQDGQPFIGGPVVGHGPNGNGQNLASVLGKILRIDPLGNNSANGNYGIPADNPFVGTPGAVGEVWAYGFRNPFRFTFDSALHHLWRRRRRPERRGGGRHRPRRRQLRLASQGRRLLLPAERHRCRLRQQDRPGRPAGLIDPVAQYDHDEAISVIGGYVAHSPSLHRLNAHYVFGEFAKSFANDGRLFYLKKRTMVRKNGKLQKSSIAEVRYPANTSLGFSPSASARGRRRRDLPARQLDGGAGGRHGHGRESLGAVS